MALKGDAELVSLVKIWENRELLQQVGVQRAQESTMIQQKLFLMEIGKHLELWGH